MKDLSYRIVQGNAVRTKTKMLRDSDFAEEPPGEPRVAGVAAARDKMDTSRKLRRDKHEMNSGNSHKRPERNRTQREWHAPRHAQTSN